MEIRVVVMIYNELLQSYGISVGVKQKTLKDVFRPIKKIYTVYIYIYVFPVTQPSVNFGFQP